MSLFHILDLISGNLDCNLLLDSSIKFINRPFSLTSLESWVVHWLPNLDEPQTVVHLSFLHVYSDRL